MRDWKTTLFFIIWAVAFITSTCFISLTIADDLAYKGALNDEYLDLYECAIQEDYNCRIETIDNHNRRKGEVTYLCVYNDDETSSFLVTLELKKVAPFRYEWIEVDL